MTDDWEDATRHVTGTRGTTAGSEGLSVRRRTVLKGIGLGSVGTTTLGNLPTGVRGRLPDERTPTATDTGGASTGPWAEAAKLTADDGDSRDKFGCSVALAGDTALVGAYRDEDPNGKDGGSAYVFERSDGSWSQATKLAALDGEPLDVFGESVALAGQTALVGTLAADSAYVFERSGGTWSQAAKLTAPGDGDDDGLDQFGNSVALAGDTALVGAPWDEDPNGSSTGSAYVFERSGADWTRAGKLTADDGDSDEYFGDSVALDGDTALLGAAEDEVPEGDSGGSAYVFERSGGTWSRRAKLTADGGDDEGRFGIHVALTGDTALVGAPMYVDSNDTRGSAYVFERSGDTWTRAAKLEGDDDEGDPGDYFGYSVALAGDTALVGAFQDEDPNGKDAGSAYVFERGDGDWTRVAKLAADGDDTYDYFGQSVALDGTTALLGADEDGDPYAPSGGAAYVFERSEESTPTVTPEKRGEDDDSGGIPVLNRLGEFGWAVGLGLGVVGGGGYLAYRRQGDGETQ